MEKSNKGLVIKHIHRIRKTTAYVLPLKSHKKCKRKENAKKIMLGLKTMITEIGVGKVQRGAMLDGLSFPI